VGGGGGVEIFKDIICLRTR